MQLGLLFLRLLTTSDFSYFDPLMLVIIPEPAGLYYPTPLGRIPPRAMSLLPPFSFPYYLFLRV